MPWAFLTKAIWHVISVRCLVSRPDSFDGRSASNKASGQSGRCATSADLPVVQCSKFEFHQPGNTKVLGIEVPPGLVAIADEVVE